MNDISYLKSFSIKEIALKTHLDEARIKAIINKDYEKLSSINIAMNIKILEREYDIDFSEWLNEYNEYKQTHLEDTKNSLKIKPKVMSYNHDKDSTNTMSYLIYLIIAILLVVGGAFYYFNYLENDSEESNQITIKEEKPQENLIIKPEIKEEIKEIKPEIKEEIIEVTKPAEEIKEEIKSKETEKIEPKVENIEAIKPAETKEEIKTINQSKQEEKIEIKNEHKLFFNPSAKSWLSVKNLKTKETKNYMVTKGVSFTQDSLIFVGNNLFTLELDGENVELPKDGDSRYILFKDGKVKFLTQKEYSKLDKAK